jgi:Protein of unknown function (DUF4236)
MARRRSVGVNAVDQYGVNARSVFGLSLDAVEFHFVASGKNKMGRWRFRKSYGNKFFRLNISKTGFSITSGVPGAHVNADLSNRRKRMFRNTFGIPGSGLYYQTDDYGPPRKEISDYAGLSFAVGVIIIFILLVAMSI